MVRTLVPVLAPVPEPGLFPIDHDAVTLEPLRVRLVVLLVAGCCLATACNVVQFQQASIVASLRDHGLTSHRFELGDATVRCWSRPGRGTPVVLLHGFGTPALWQWSEQVPALDGRPLVLPDLLWFGGSSSRTRDYTLDHQVRVLAALLDELGLQRVDVVGISYGGLVAVELATAHPELVRRLVIVDSPGREYTRADHAAMLARLGVDHIGRVMIPASDEDVRRMMEVAYAHPPWVPDFVLSQVREHFFPSRRRADLYAVLDALERDLDMLRARPDPEAPVLLVWGRGDPVFPLEIARRLQRRLGSDTRLEIIDDARHTPNIERPEEFNRILVDFLSE